MTRILRRILVAEDDPVDARLLGENLKDAFGEAVTMLHRRTLAEALEALGKEAVNAVLLDLRLPDGEGPESVRRIREVNPDVPVVVVTHLDDLPTALACIDAGAQDYISKAEVHPGALRRVVAHAMERQHLRRAAEVAREMERAAEQKARELAAVVEHAQEAIVTWDLEGRIVSFNPAAERLCGIGAAEAVGKAIDEFIPEELREDFRRRVKMLRDGGKVPVARTFRRRRDGSEFEIEESMFAVLDVSGRPLRFACVARDVTELLRLKRAAEILGSAGPAGGPDEPIARAPSMVEILEAADLVAQDPTATVLILGETGVGKGWLARRIHRRSLRADRPFFEVNCAGLAPALVESELFGHERGSFTGAVAQKRGLVEAAEGGTLFLDEIAELPPEIQAQLLTFVDTRTFRRVGGNRALTSDVRLLAATNQDLAKAVDRGAFRRDLYYRLSVVPIRVPPLRERRLDIPDLAKMIARDVAGRTGRRGVPIAPEVLAALQRHEWPGNVRELHNALERAIILSRGGEVRVEHIPPEVRGEGPSTSSNKLEELEVQHILTVLQQVEGNRTRAAEVLGISRSTLKRKLALMKQSSKG